MTHRPFSLLTAAVLLLGVGPAVRGDDKYPTDPGVPAVKTDNANAVLKKHKDSLTVTASTSWPGWEPEKVADGQVQTSWFSGDGDAAAKGTEPWVQIELPADETVKQVTVLGNREPDWWKDFAVRKGRLELLNKDRNRLWSEERKSAGDAGDFEFKPKEAVKGVRFVRFTSLEDEGDKNGFNDIAVGEILVDGGGVKYPTDPGIPEVKTDNSNAILKEYKEKVVVTASTAWPGWEPGKLIDGQVQTSWFSAGGDAVAKGTKPWVQVELPADETVRRVTVLGNREPSWLKNFTVRAGLLELLDKDKKRLWADEMKGAGAAADFEFKPKEAIKGVRYVRFLSLEDEGDKNGYDDIAIGEILIE